MRGPSGRVLPYAVLAVALVGVSFGSIFVRLAAAPALAIALWRMTLASAVVLPAALASGGIRPATSARAMALAAAAGGLLALHFGSWMTSLLFTSVANSVLLVNTAPIFVALLSWISGRDRPTSRTWAAVVLATAGAAVITSGGPSDATSLIGNLLAVGGALAMAGYLLLAREAQRVLAYLPYVAVAYGTAAVVLWAAVLISGTQWHSFPPQTWAVLAAMAVVSQLVGHGGYNWSLRHLQAAFVSIALTGEPVLASLLAWWLLDEPIGARTALGGVLVLSGIVVAARARR
ncbi:MAG TPA: DMT family transporter [Steroidobacteraceae bacterium]|nr:DMT family transporter [Steroidobacteraceae bacterium]